MSATTVIPISDVTKDEKVIQEGALTIAKKNPSIILSIEPKKVAKDYQGSVFLNNKWKFDNKLTTGWWITAE